MKEIRKTFPVPPQVAIESDEEEQDNQTASVAISAPNPANSGDLPGTIAIGIAAVSLHRCDQTMSGSKRGDDGEGWTHIPGKQERWGYVGMYVTVYDESTESTYVLMAKRAKCGSWATPGGGADFSITRDAGCMTEDLAYRMSAPVSYTHLTLPTKA